MKGASGQALRWDGAGCPLSPSTQSHAPRLGGQLCNLEAHAEQLAQGC